MSGILIEDIDDDCFEIKQDIIKSLKFSIYLLYYRDAVKLFYKTNKDSDYIKIRSDFHTNYMNESYFKLYEKIIKERNKK